MSINKNTASSGIISERPSMLKMTWPIFIELTLQMLVGYIDQFMISNYDEALVGAVTNATRILNIIILIFSVISTAATILIAQYLGANRHDKLSEVYTLTIVINAVTGVIFSGALVLLAKQFVGWFKISDVNAGPFIIYTQIVGGFMFLQAVFLSYSALFKSNGLMKYTMIFAVVMNVVNTVGNWLLIYGIGPFKEMGITGAAISTSFSKLVGLILIMICYKRSIDVPLTTSVLKPFPKDMLRRMLKIGIPSAGENISYDMSQLAILVIVNIIGYTALNTYSYANMFSYLCCLFSMSVGSSLRIMVGYLIGAKEKDEIKKVVSTSIVWSMILSVGITVIILIFSDSFFSIFTKDPAVLVLGKQVILVEIFLEIGRTINIIMVSSLQAAGDIKFPVVLGIISNWSVAVLLSYIFGIVLNMGLVGVWIAMASDECLRGLVYLFRFRSGVWKKKNLID